MRRWGPVYVACALLLLAASVGGWDWWSTHDLEVLGRFRNVPVIGQTLERAMGAEVRPQAITIAVDASYPPFASLDAEGKMVGFEVELAAELGRRLAERPRLVNMDAGDGLFEALAARKVDAVIAGLTYYPEVTRDVVYSDGYFEAGPGILARADRVDVTGARDLAGKRVAIEIGSMGEEEAKRLRDESVGMELVAMNDAHRILAALSEGAVDAAILDRPSIPVGEPALAGIRGVGPPLRSLPYLIGVRRKDAGLLLAINRELDAMKSEGILLQMEKRWFQ